MLDRIILIAFVTVCILELLLATGAFFYYYVLPALETADEDTEEVPEYPEIDPVPLLADLAHADSEAE